jgi:hypothetical protein
MAPDPPREPHAGAHAEAPGARVMEVDDSWPPDAGVFEAASAAPAAPGPDAAGAVPHAPPSYEAPGEPQTLAGAATAVVPRRARTAILRPPRSAESLMRAAPAPGHVGMDAAPAAPALRFDQPCCANGSCAAATSADLHAARIAVEERRIAALLVREEADRRAVAAASRAKLAQATANLSATMRAIEAVQARIVQLVEARDQLMQRHLAGDVSAPAAPDVPSGPEAPGGAAQAAPSRRVRVVRPPPAPAPDDDSAPKRRRTVARDVSACHLQVAAAPVDGMEVDDEHAAGAGDAAGAQEAQVVFADCELRCLNPTHGPDCAGCVHRPPR